MNSKDKMKKSLGEDSLEEIGGKQDEAVKIQIRLDNHQEWATIQEMAALFSDQVTLGEDLVTVLLPGEHEQLERDEMIEVFSSLSESVDREALQGKIPHTPVRVTTSWSQSRENQKRIEKEAPATSIRRELKRQLYACFQEITGIQWPWGSLTGIRPTQVAWECFNQQDGDRKRALEELKSTWFVSSEKSVKALRTAQKEQEILKQIPRDQWMVYAGIPFCPGRCSYCSFIAQDATAQRDWLEPYVEALLMEARVLFEAVQTPLSAFYLGGGTPTSLPEPLFQKLLEGLLTLLPLAPEAEITVEAGRPDTITAGKLHVMRDCGVQRICINPQTLQSKTLEKIGRFHTVEDFFSVYDQARRAGFNHINTDLILGLPGETREDFMDTITRLLSIEPDSITVHTLALKRSARIQQEESQRYLPLRFPDPIFSETLGEGEMKICSSGYEPYYLYRQKNVRGGLENTGFARPNKECRYNVGMMSDEITVVGLGSGSSSKKVTGRLVERLHNSKDLRDYTLRAEEIAEKKVAFFTQNSASAPGTLGEPESERE